MTTNYEEQLKNHIEALESQYENLITLLKEPLETDEESGKVKLKDSQKKVYAEGVAKIVETADSLIERIRDKKLELEKIQNKNGEADFKNDNPKKNEVVEQPNNGSNLGNRLR